MMNRLHYHADNSAWPANISSPFAFHQLHREHQYFPQPQLAHRAFRSLPSFMHSGRSPAMLLPCAGTAVISTTYAPRPAVASPAMPASRTQAAGQAYGSRSTSRTVVTEVQRWRVSPGLTGAAELPTEDSEGWASHFGGRFCHVLMDRSCLQINVCICRHHTKIQPRVTGRHGKEASYHLELDSPC